MSVGRLDGQYAIVAEADWNQQMEIWNGLCGLQSASGFLGSDEQREEHQDDYLDDPTDDANSNSSKRASIIQSLSNGNDHGDQHPPCQACVSVTCPAYSRNPISTRPESSSEGCSGPAILDTAQSKHKPFYLNRLGSPRSPNHRKFSEALMHHNIPCLAAGTAGRSPRSSTSWPSATTASRCS